MKPMIAVVFLVVTSLASFSLHVHAEEQMDDLAIIKGLVVSSGHVLTINDGVRDYQLLGVDNSDFEGKVCEVIGSISIGDIMPEIKVKTITIIAVKYPDHDLIGFRSTIDSPYSGQRRPGILGSAMISHGAAMPCLRPLNLPTGNGVVCIGERGDRFAYIPPRVRT